MIRYSPHPEPITRINVTPIIDVALVLVIILLVTAPMLSVADLPVDLPRARSRDAEDERNVSVTLGANGELAVDQQRIASQDLRTVLSARLSEPGNADVLVVVRADSGAPHAEVRALLNEARAAGATRLAIATRQDVEPAGSTR
jgi:biopolymer transport protein TolR